MPSLRTMNYVIFPILLVATLIGLNWPWGVLFLWWLFTSVMSGEAFLVDAIERNSDPFLFWAVVILWALFGFIMIAADLFPQFAVWLA